MLENKKYSNNDWDTSKSQEPGRQIRDNFSININDAKPFPYSRLPTD